MDIDPHTLQQILQRIYQQMRCPQCSKRVPVDFSAVQVVSGSGMLLQLKCEGCNAFIVLHASLQGVEHIGVEQQEEQLGTHNVSSSLDLGEKEVSMLQSALEESDGSFEKMFAKYGGEVKEETSE